MSYMSHKLLSLGIAAGILVPNVVLAEQVIIQQGSTSATAIGNHNYAASSVNQSSVQNQAVNPNTYINEQGQVSIQQGNSNAAAVGNNNTVTSNITQDSVQYQQGNYSDHHNQTAVQNATDNSTAIGDRNRIINTTGQYNLQNQWSY